MPTLNHSDVFRFEFHRAPASWIYLLEALSLLPVAVIVVAQALRLLIR
jgi:hypothetical protein